MKKDGRKEINRREKIGRKEGERRKRRKRRKEMKRKKRRKGGGEGGKGRERRKRRKRRNIIGGEEGSGRREGREDI